MDTCQADKQMNSCKTKTRRLGVCEVRETHQLYVAANCTVYMHFMEQRIPVAGVSRQDRLCAGY